MKPKSGGESRWEWGACRARAGWAYLHFRHGGGGAAPGGAEDSLVGGLTAQRPNQAGSESQTPGRNAQAEWIAVGGTGWSLCVSAGGHSRSSQCSCAGGHPDRVGLHPGRGREEALVESELAGGGRTCVYPGLRADWPQASGPPCKTRGWRSRFPLHT